MDDILKNDCFKKKFPIILVSHNNKWIQWYNEEEVKLSKLLRGISIRIYHIGSTAIPSIKSKNIIDIIIETIDNRNFETIVDTLSKEWELCWNEQERAFLVKGYGEKGFSDKVFHLHIRKNNDITEVEFKNILLKFPRIAKEYECLKLKLEKEYKFDREGYTEGKTEFIDNIIREYSLHK